MGALIRMDSDDTMYMMNNERGFCGVCPSMSDRNCLGSNLPSNKRSGYQKMDKKNSNKHHRKITSTGSVDYEETGDEPKLMRSGGLRRDWSFQNLLQKIRHGSGKRNKINVDRM